MWRRLFRFAFAIAALLITTGVEWRLLGAESSPKISGERLQLMAALGPVRPIEGRLSGFSYSPWLGPSVPLVSRDNSKELRYAGLKIGAERNESSRLSDLAVLDLLFGKLPEAVARLEKASRRSPSTAPLLNDLGAAYLARGNARHAPHDFMLALGTLGEALKCDSGFLEARFNQALALEKFSLSAQARSAWKEYERLDPGSGWSEEARHHLAALSGESESVAWPLAQRDLVAAAAKGDSPRVLALTNQWRRQARRLVEDDLLGRWGSSYLARRGNEAAEALTTARSIASALAQVEANYLDYDAIATIDQALESESRATVELLAEGHAAVAEALTLARQGNDSAAVAAFKRGSESLAAADSPFQAFAGPEAALSRIYVGNYLEALEGLAPMRRSVDGRRYPTLAARALWMTGLAHLKLADFANSLTAYREALALYERTGELESLAALHFLLGESLRLQGEVSESWNHRWQALALSRGLDLSHWFHNALYDAAEASLSQAQPRVALLFQDEMVEQARLTRDPIDVVESLVRRSRVYNTIGDRDSAFRDLRTADAWCGQVVDSAQRGTLSADIIVAMGEVLIESDPLSSAHQFGQAIRFFGSQSALFRLPKLYHEQAQAYLKGGDAERAHASLLAGITESERESKQISERQLGIAYRDQVHSLFEEMVRLEIDVRGHPAEAFGYIERSRAQVLLSDFAAAGGSPTRAEGYTTESSNSVGTLDQVRRRLPSEVALLSYAVLPDRVFAWCITAEGADFLVLGTTAELRARIQALREFLPGTTWDVTAANRAADLYRFLVEPFHARVAGKTALVVVPDRDLFAVPFAALINPTSGRFLLEERVLGYAPSATLYLGMNDRALALATKQEPERALIVGDPAFDLDVFPDLARLTGSEREAREIALLYTRPKLLLGPQASKGAFLEALSQAMVIHLTSHSRVDAESSLLSGFVLAPTHRGEVSDTGFLSAAELYRLPPLSAQLVVLGACSTNAGRTESSEGLASLVRPFLAAGVPSVIGSLWPVDDKASEQLMVELHRHLRRGEGAAQALRAAQIALINNSDRSLQWPSSWASFQVTGSTTSAARNLRRNDG